MPLSRVGRLIAVLATALAVAWMVLVFLPTHLAPHSSGDRLKAISDFRTAAVQLLAGVAVLAGLTYTARTYRLSQEGQLIDRFSDAVARLDSTSSAVVQLAGVYSLEQVAKDSPSFSETVRDVLVAFVTDNASSSGAVQLNLPTQAAMTVLGRHKRSEGTRQLTLKDLELPRVQLRRAQLDLAELSHAVLTEADLSDARLQRADLSCCNLSRADLSGAHLQGANLLDAVLHETNFYKAKLQGARVRPGALVAARNVDQQQLDEVLEDP